MFPLLHIGSFELSTWRLVVLGGVVLCWILFLVRVRRLGYSVFSVLPWLLLGVPVGTLGGHLFNKLIPVLVGSATTPSPLSGLTVVGSIFSCVAFSYFYIKYVIKIPVSGLLDAVAFTFPLSIFIGRIGCLMAGCCYGKPAPDLHGSVLSLFTLHVGFYASFSAAGHDYAGWPHEARIWNLPLLLMLNTAVLLVVTETLYRKRQRWHLAPGTVFAATCTLYAFGRFFVEFFRKEEGAADTLFNPWQLSILVLFLISFAWLVVCLARRSRIVHQKQSEAHA